VYKLQIPGIDADSRKALTYRIGELVGIEPHYEGAGGNQIDGERFRYCYTIGALTIAQDGTLVWHDHTNPEFITRILDGLAAEGFEFDRTNLGANEAAAPEVEPEPSNVPAWFEAGLAAATGRTEEPETADAEVAADSTEVTTDGDRLSIFMPLTGFTPEKLANLVAMVNAKEILLKAALETDELPIKQHDATLEFAWFNLTDDPEVIHAYTLLVSQLCKTAIEKQRVTAKPADDLVNPKYAMRCFLLSLGFIGSDFKAARKQLVSKLSGNSSWLNGKPETADEVVEEVADDAVAA